MNVKYLQLKIIFIPIWVLSRCPHSIAKCSDVKIPQFLPAGIFSPLAVNVKILPSAAILTVSSPKSSSTEVWTESRYPIKGLITPFEAFPPLLPFFSLLLWDPTLFIPGERAAGLHPIVRWSGKLYIRLDTPPLIYSSLGTSPTPPCRTFFSCLLTETLTSLGHFGNVLTDYLHALGYRKAHTWDRKVEGWCSQLCPSLSNSLAGDIDKVVSGNPCLFPLWPSPRLSTSNSISSSIILSFIYLDYFIQSYNEMHEFQFSFFIEV